MMNIVNFIRDNWDSFVAVFGGLVTVATVIVGLTPTSKDNKILDYIVKFFNTFSVVNPKEDQDIIEKNKDNNESKEI